MLQDTTNLCREFQKRYSQLHPNKSAFHNIYVCQSVDTDGNVTDTKYGMNSLTDFGIKFLFGAWNQLYTLPTTGQTVDIMAQSHYYRRLFYTSNGYRTTYIVFGEDVDDDVEEGVQDLYFSNPWVPASRFIISSIGNPNYTSPDKWHTFSDGIISGNMLGVTGYFDYNVNDTNGNKVTENGILTRVGILFNKTYFNYNASRDAFTDNPIVCHARIYDADGNPSSIIKKPNEKLYVTIYVSCSMDASIYDRLWNEHGVTGGISLTDLLRCVSNTDGAYRNALWGNLSSTQFVYHDTDPSFMVCIPTYDVAQRSVTVTTTEHSVTRTFNNVFRYIFMEDQFQAQFMYAITSPGAFRIATADYICSTMTFMLAKLLQLDEPETLICDYVHTYSAFYPSFNANTFNGTNDKLSMKGFFHVYNFNITDVRRYNHSTHSWSDVVPFMAQPDNTYTTALFNISFLYSLLVNGKHTVCNVFFNPIKDKNTGKCKKIKSFNNASGRVIYATDSFWDPDSWVFISDPSNIPEELQDKRYFVQTSPIYTIPNDYGLIHANTHTGYFDKTKALSPVYDNQPMKLLNSEPIYIKQLPVNGELVDITGSTPIWGRNYDGAYKRDYDNRFWSFKVVGNDDTDHPWVMCGEAVVFFDKDITKVTHYQPLLPANIYTTDIGSYWGKLYTRTGRYQYKDRVVILQSHVLREFAVYDFSDPDNIQQWLVGNDTTVNTGSIGQGYYSTGYIYHQSGRYLVSYYRNFNTGDESATLSHILDIGETGEQPSEYLIDGLYWVAPILNTKYLVGRTESAGGQVLDFVVINIEEYINTVKANQNLSEEEQVDPIQASTVRTFSIDIGNYFSAPMRGVAGFDNHIYIGYYNGSNVRVCYYNIESQELKVLVEINTTFADTFVHDRKKHSNTHSYRYRASDIANSFEYSHMYDGDGNSVMVISSLYGFSTTFRDSDPTTPVLLWTYEDLGSNYSPRYRNDNTVPIMKNINGQLIFAPWYTPTWYCLMYEQQSSVACLGIIDFGVYLDSDDKPSDYFINNSGFTREQPICPYHVDAYNSGVGRRSCGWYFLKDKVIDICHTDNSIAILPLNNFLPLKMTGTTTTIQSYNNPKGLTIPPLSITFSNNGIGVSSNDNP